MKYPMLTTRSPQVAAVAKTGAWWGGTNRLHLVLKDGAWKGEPCFIVGGGPSLRGFDFQRLRGRRCITINRAFQFWPASDLNFCMDLDYYYRLHREDTPLARAWAAYPGIKVWLDMAGFELAGVRTVRALGDSGEPSSLEDGIFHGANSGYCALQLAYLLGCAPIYLLGFDMQHGPGGVVHFYDNGPGYPPESTYRGFIRFFDQLPPQVARLVVNLNPASALRSFKFGDVDAVLPNLAPGEPQDRQTPLAATTPHDTPASPSGTPSAARRRGHFTPGGDNADRLV